MCPNWSRPLTSMSWFGGQCFLLLALLASPCWAFVVGAAGALPGLRFRAAPAPTAMALTSEEYKKNVENIRKARTARESARAREREGTRACEGASDSERERARERTRVRERERGVLSWAARGEARSESARTSPPRPRVLTAPRASLRLGFRAHGRCGRRQRRSLWLALQLRSFNPVSVYAQICVCVCACVYVCI